MKSAIIKRSVVLDGHKTSVSLENEFWDGLREIAKGQKANLSTLVRQINLDRSTGNLSSAIRVFVYKYFRREENAVSQQPSATGQPRAGNLAGRTGARALTGARDRQ